MTFQQLPLIPQIQKALQEIGYKEPTPIQAKAIPIVLEQQDLIGCAQTGTGKTAAFAIPTIQLLCNSQNQNRQRKIRSLILTPTRELAIQIGESFQTYGKYTGLKHLVIFGGVGQKPQTDALKRGIDVLVATPGRLLDLMGQGFVHLSDVQIFTLDEADRMLDMGFVNDVKKVIAKLPRKRQSLFFSATMPKSIVSFANTILTNPKKVEVTPVSSTAETIQQSVYFVDKKQKRKLLLHVLNSLDMKSTLVFTRTKHGANRVVKELCKKNIQAEAIHGNKSQTARQKALRNFKEGRTSVLVATDIAARGIDIDELSHVINFDIPNISETYVHRIGRTGRAGADGVAFSFCQEDEMPYLRDIQKLIGKEIPIIEEHPFPPTYEVVAMPLRRPKKQQTSSRPEKNQHRGRKRPDKRTLRRREKENQRTSPQQNTKKTQQHSSNRNTEKTIDKAPNPRHNQSNRPSRSNPKARAEKSANTSEDTSNSKNNKPQRGNNRPQKKRVRENKEFDKVDFKVKRKPIIEPKREHKKNNKHRNNTSKNASQPKHHKKSNQKFEKQEVSSDVTTKRVSSLAKFKEKWKRRDKKVEAKQDD